MVVIESLPLKEADERAVAAGALCSGGIAMPSESTAPDGSGSAGNEGVQRVLALIAEAIEIVDELSLSPEIGAKLQEAINAIDERHRG